MSKESILPPLGDSGLPELSGSRGEQFAPRSEGPAPSIAPSAVPYTSPNPLTAQMTASTNSTVNSATSSVPPITDKATQKKVEQHFADKTKQIIAQNSDDPYREAHLVDETKRDYLKEAYHRTIKIPEM